MNFLKLNKIFSKWSIIIIFLLLSLLIIRMLPIYDNNDETEGFTNYSIEKFTQKEKIEDIYDDFYVKVYDQLFYSDQKNNFEITNIEKKTDLSKSSKILDIGCGTGSHAYFFDKSGYNVIGLDKSKSMINYCKKSFPKITFKLGDATNTLLFNEGSFTHITCLYFTMYYISNKRQFFENCMYWLQPGGYLVVHLVNKKMFDPIVPSGNPLFFVSPQKYAKSRITHTDVKFKNFEYSSNFHISDSSSNAKFIEEFKTSKSKQFRKNVHKLYMNTQKEILGIAKNMGFIVFSKMHMTECEYEYNFLYFLQKPF